MVNRDKLILDDLKKFRILNRDQIIAMHFNHLKQKVVVCNNVMKRLRRDGYVTACTESQPYNYFLNPSPIKKDSKKIPHFNAISSFYIEACKYQKPTLVQIEPKLAEKSTIEPDIFMIWLGSPLFVEIQRSIYSAKVMQQKINRYKTYFESEEWMKASWQKDKKVFPYIWIITDYKYKLDDVSPLQIFQTKDVDEFMKTIVKQ
ncbi:replication-relaxation family protein [Fictibacillus sp. 5RED26]|uniref:replication-relaxation family protein n=1 Tax=Fictibacillus sp. 5RED26 TaxID=2745876 RepID=UPI0018CD0643|nr:replication-relaxation family protein [Fictibacillus sp. 5RED26]MBH0156007.1 replication-relaxation family protein [Fictibacillus sp. 5RED26]